MKIKDMTMEKAEDLQWKMAGQAKAQFVQKVAAEDGLSIEDQQQLCLGETDPVDYHYTLGYKLQDPVWQVGIFGPATKKGRLEMIEKFKIAAQLTPEEIEIFNKEVLTTKPWKAFKIQMKRKSK